LQPGTTRDRAGRTVQPGETDRMCALAAFSLPSGKMLNCPKMIALRSLFKTLGNLTSHLRRQRTFHS